MIRVGDLALYSLLKADSVMPFTLDVQRTVKLTVNAPVRTQVFVQPMHADGALADADPMFLCSVEGLDEIEFFARGAFGIVADADLHVRTRDGEEIHVVALDPASFTRISERRARNPELERLQHLMEKNTERRMGIMFEEMRARENAIRNAAQADNKGAGAPSGNSPAPEPAPSGGQPAPSPSSAGGGTDGG